MLLDVVAQIARHRGDHFYPLACQEFGEVFLPGLLQDREVAAIHRPDTELARLAHQAPEMRIKLGRPAGNIESWDLLTAKKAHDLAGDRAAHFLGAVRPRIDVTVDAGLIAAIADVDLQRFQLAPPDGRKSNLVEQRQRIAHRKPRLRRNLP